MSKAPKPHFRPVNDVTSPVTTSVTPRYFLVLPAAGSGRRMQTAVPKQYLEVAGKTLLQHTLERLGTLPEFTRIVVALAAEDADWPVLATQLPPGIAGKLLVTAGGAERMQSVANALAALQPFAGPDDWVLVHDAVRPCVSHTDVRTLMRELEQERAGGLLAVPVRETLKESNGGQLVQRTVDRSRIWQAATPQMFRFAVLQRALHQASTEQKVVTDEAAAVEALGLPVRLVPGRADNIKVTYPEDLILVAAVLQQQAAEFTDN
jgi:2-C-methyl-D-erythritol 4-phosphate cytidylyltransferase